MDSISERTSLVEGRIATSTKLAYALGHIFNDLTAAMWFSYTLIYLQRVVLLQPIVAGALLLLGQVVDAIMTPVFGCLIDRYCKKKIWHVLGSVMITLTFPVIFGGFAHSFSLFVIFLYVTSIAIFQTGWAVVQISHLSMIPSLTNSLLDRADLTAIRYSGQVSAAVIVYVVTWIVLPTNGDSLIQLGQQDDYKFRNIVLVLTALGLTATIFFHWLLKANLLERSVIVRKARIDVPTEINSVNRWTSNEWTRITILLRVAMLYVASRLFITLSAVYLPLYIEETKVGGKQALATVPLVSYVSSFVAVLLLKYINRCCGTKIILVEENFNRFIPNILCNSYTIDWKIVLLIQVSLLICYFLGIVIGITAATVTEFAESDTTIVYLIAVLIGAGSSIMMVTALNVTAELIGSRTERSALVYSIVTFLDKIVTGLIVILIERWRCDDKEFCPNYNRDTLSIVCASSMLLGLLTLLSVSRCLT